MSYQLISRSPDLQALLEEGYFLEILADHLLVHDVPYVTANGKTDRGTLVSTLNHSGGTTRPPETHVAYWIGEFPCYAKGGRMDAMGSPNAEHPIKPGLAAQHTLSRKPIPANAYTDYHQKMTTYISIIEEQARAVDAKLTARTHRPFRLAEEESVFLYADTGASGTGVASISNKLERFKVAIVGLGGTGSYVLDFVAKTPVAEIHLFDGDVFDGHNAFRSPGAAAVEELDRSPTKLARFTEIYSRMRRKVIPHDGFLTGNLDQLDSMDFVFLCLDKGTPKRKIVESLIEKRISFLEAGMGLYLRDDSLGGLV